MNNNTNNIGNSVFEIPWNGYRGLVILPSERFGENWEVVVKDHAPGVGHRLEVRIKPPRGAMIIQRHLRDDFSEVAEARYVPDWVISVVQSLCPEALEEPELYGFSDYSLKEKAEKDEQLMLVDEDDDDTDIDIDEWWDTFFGFGK